MEKNLNIREVARIAGVSPATVSRVMNGTAKVSEEKRERVLAAISQTDFVPNEVARMLFKKSSKLIGLIIPSIRNPFFTELASLIDQAASENGYRLFLCNVGNRAICIIISLLKPVTVLWSPTVQGGQFFWPPVLVTVFCPSH